MSKAPDVQDTPSTTPGAEATEKERTKMRKSGVLDSESITVKDIVIGEGGGIVKFPAIEDREQHLCYEGHEFELTSVYKFTYCNYCRNILMGLPAQGYVCRICGLCFHPKCLRKVFPPVNHAFEAIEAAAAAEAAAASEVVGCRSNVSLDSDEESEEEEITWGPEGDPEEAMLPIEPGVTELFIHCKQSACFDPHGLRRHQWVEGNTYLSFNGAQTRCIKCGVEAGSLLAFTDWRCLWCGCLIHSACKDMDPDLAAGPCTRGPFRRLLVDPNNVAFNDTTGKWVAVPAPSGDATALGSKDAPSDDSGEGGPLIVYGNTVSGGQCGAQTLDGYRRILNPKQVFCLNEPPMGTEKGFEFAYNLGGQYRILCCGGDGSIGWVLESLHAKGLKIPVGILPLGTGNDLSRALGWGPTFTPGDPLDRVLFDILRARRIELDRWELRITPIHFDERKGGEAEEEKAEIKYINNYFSIGSDAAIALQFHEKRQRDPDAFKSPLRNKVLYTFLGATEMFTPNNRLFENIRLEVDGKEVNLRPYNSQCIAFVNLPNMYSGATMWGSKLSKAELDKGFIPTAISDGIIEVVSIKNAFELGTIGSGLFMPDKIAQGRSVRITFLKDVTYPCQYDGEPYTQKPAVLEISLLEKATLLEVPPN